ncbi:MAG: sulfotransferase family protein [Bacillota bacterium]
MKPSLFIIGGPKCGTTAMCSYLAEHPEVCFAVPKEPKYFNTDFAPERREALTEKAYLRCFRANPRVHKLLAEGTVWYLYSQVAVPNILHFNPDARFVVMIRNPVDLAYSLHSQLYYGGLEDVGDFETAWRLQEARKRGQDLPRGTRDAKSLLYGDVAKLGEQVERLFKTVPRERVLIINYDDFSRDPRSQYDRVLAFADLSPHPREQFARHNENRALRTTFLAAAIFRLKRLKSALGLKKSFGIWHWLQPLVARKQERPRMAKRLEEELQTYFAADIQELERQTDLNLSSWKQGRDRNVA